jgi:transglutaminase-like putative cysteine protease
MVSALNAEELKQRKFEFSYTATLSVPNGAKSARLWLPLPKSDLHQEIRAIQIRSAQPISFATDAEYSNAMLMVAADNPAAGQLTVEMSFQVLRRENINRPATIPIDTTKKVIDAPEPLMPRWLQADRMAPISPRIRELAAEVTGGKTSDLEKVKAIYDYALANLKYDKTSAGWGRGDIHFVCDEKRGNCTDFHTLVIGLCRAVGIPARFEMGFSVPNDKPEGQISGYHCWAQVYIKGLGWLPIDASEASKNLQQKDYFFGGHDEHRVQFTIGRDIPLPGSHTEPINFFIYPYGEIDQKPIDKIEIKLLYKNL